MSHKGNGRDPSDVTNELLQDIQRKMATKADLELMATKADLELMATKADLELMIETMGTMATKMATQTDVNVLADMMGTMAAKVATKADLKMAESRIGERIKTIRRAIRETHGRHGLRINALEKHTGLRPR
jgi:hypothetical protein